VSREGVVARWYWAEVCREEEGLEMVGKEESCMRTWKVVVAGLLMARRNAEE
jgi:hypothetical protein